MGVTFNDFCEKVSLEHTIVSETVDGERVTKSLTVGEVWVAIMPILPTAKIVTDFVTQDGVMTMNDAYFMYARSNLGNFDTVKWRGRLLRRTTCLQRVEKDLWRCVIQSFERKNV